MCAQRAYLQGLDGKLQVIDGTRRACEVEDVVHGTLDVDLVADIVLDEGEVVTLDVLEVRWITGNEVVHTNDFVITREEVIRQV